MEFPIPNDGNWNYDFRDLSASKYVIESAKHKTKLCIPSSQFGNKFIGNNKRVSLNERD